MDKKVYTAKNGDVFKSELVCKVFGSSHFTLEDIKKHDKDEYEAFNFSNDNGETVNALDRLERNMLFPFYTQPCNICSPSDSLASNYSEIKVACTKTDYLNFMSSYAYTKNVYTGFLSIIAQNYVQWTIDLDKEIFLDGPNRGSIAYPVKAKGLDSITMEEYIPAYDTIVPKKILSSLVKRIQDLNPTAELKLKDTDIVIITLRYYGPYNKSIAYVKPTEENRKENTARRCSSFSKLMDNILDVYNNVDYLKIK